MSVMNKLASIFGGGNMKIGAKVRPIADRYSDMGAACKELIGRVQSVEEYERGIKDAQARLGVSLTADQLILAMGWFDESRLDEVKKKFKVAMDLRKKRGFHI